MPRCRRAHARARALAHSATHLELAYGRCTDKGTQTGGVNGAATNVDQLGRAQDVCVRVLQFFDKFIELWLICVYRYDLKISLSVTTLYDLLLRLSLVRRLLHLSKQQDFVMI